MVRVKIGVTGKAFFMFLCGILWKYYGRLIMFYYWVE